MEEKQTNHVFLLIKWSHNLSNISTMDKLPEKGVRFFSSTSFHTKPFDMLHWVGGATGHSWPTDELSDNNWVKRENKWCLECIKWKEATDLFIYFPKQYMPEQIKFIRTWREDEESDKMWCFYGHSEQKSAQNAQWQNALILCKK